METLAFLSQKGGSGKTTLAVHTAVAAQECGERVVVVDTEMQKSATTWKQARTDGHGIAPLQQAQFNKIAKGLATASSRNR
jgi:chromosome partitioning protein